MDVSLGRVTSSSCCWTHRVASVRRGAATADLWAGNHLSAAPRLLQCGGDLARINGEIAGSRVVLRIGDSKRRHADEEGGAEHGGGGGGGGSGGFVGDGICGTRKMVSLLARTRSVSEEEVVATRHVGLNGEECACMHTFSVAMRHCCINGLMPDSDEFGVVRWSRGGGGTLKSSRFTLEGKVGERLPFHFIVQALLWSSDALSRPASISIGLGANSTVSHLQHCQTAVIKRYDHDSPN